MSFTNCDSNSLPTTTHASSLIPNQFHKLCPPQTSSTFGSPSCGDGTPFSFFFSRPPARLANDKKLLIEFQGGGACWNSNTCGLQADYLTYPTFLDEFISKSCSEIEYGLSHDGKPISMLCSKSIGDTDFREYNTLIVPYCTQDVHIGDSVQYYDGEMVRHVGAHNMHSTLQWIYTNFPNPTHIFLTGCSAGGTALPIAYDLIQKHYNSLLRGSGIGMKSVDVGVVMDSSVYLTPDVFLQEYYGNWGVQSVMKKIGFNFDKYRYQSNYPDLLWQHILRRGPNSDKWGFVTHSSDPISLMYYQYMSGSNDNNGRSLAHSETNNTTVPSSRILEDNLQTEWWTGIQTSMNTVKKKHSKNADFYIIDGEGHCSFGLYYPLQDDGFEEWAAPIVKEARVVGTNRPSAVAFLCSVALGGILLIAALTAAKQKNRAKLLDDDAAALNESRRSHRMPAALLKTKALIVQQASRFSSCPWTAAYLLTCTLYFISMLISQGFAHPLDNPTLGPSAVGLSSFGINNPSLVIYRMEHYRLATSSFLCSGVITYLVVTFSMYKHATSVESTLTENNHHPLAFATVAVIILLGINLIYACIGNGASCTSLAFVLGLNVFSSVLQRRSPSSLNRMYPAHWGFTIFWAIIGSTPMFPFDSFVAVSASVVIGTVLGLLLFDNNHSDLTNAEDSYHGNSEASKEIAGPNIRWNVIKGAGVLYSIIYLLILFGVPSPDHRNVYPYLTGCNLVYSDQIGNFIEQYANGHGGGRMLEGNDDYFNGQNMCAQLCVPHLVHRPLIWGVRKLGLIEVEMGTCEDNGYDEHVADKTIREYTVTLEVQVFTQSGDQ